MDETVPRPTGTDDAVQRAAQQPLPFDDEADQPIPFALTARARREVAPEQLPPLTVVPDDQRPSATDGGTTAVSGDPDAADDTRPARARALRRAGLPIATIADRLGTDELVVRAWIGDVAVRSRRGRTSTHVAAGHRRGSSGPAAPPADGPPEERHPAFELARADARDAVRERLATDADFAAGLGLAVGIIEIDPHAVTATVRRPPVATRLLAWLRGYTGVDPDRVRVVLRLAGDVAGDLERHRWAAALGLPVEQVAHTRWRGAPTPDAAEALLRIPDPALAATLAGWRDALLEEQPVPS